jgi:uncharacterized membrane protein YebE (DUF533 family)
MTTSSNPFAKLKSATGAPSGAAPAGPTASAAAMIAAALKDGRIKQKGRDDMRFKSTASGNSRERL